MVLFTVLSVVIAWGLELILRLIAVPSLRTCCGIQRRLCNSQCSIISQSRPGSFTWLNEDNHAYHDLTTNILRNHDLLRTLLTPNSNWLSKFGDRIRSSRSSRWDRQGKACRRRLS